MKPSQQARLKGIRRARLRKRAERRAATADLRAAYNATRRAEQHPGWFGVDHGHRP